MLSLVMLALSVAVCIWIVAFSATVLLEVVAQRRGVMLPVRARRWIPRLTWARWICFGLVMIGIPVLTVFFDRPAHAALLAGVWFGMTVALRMTTQLLYKHTAPQAPPPVKIG
jgi:hypothetical protein